MRYRTIAAMNKAALLALCLLVPAAPAFADRVIGIADGDTLTVLHERRPVKIRLANIDAPEKAQPFGQIAKRSLSDLCFGKNAEVDVQTTDRYGRMVAEVTCAGVQVNRVQVERGMAWVYERYNKDRTIGVLQNQARQARRGLWADAKAVPPWEFRRPVGIGERAVSDVSAECLTGPRGGRYRMENGKKQYGC